MYAIIVSGDRTAPAGIVPTDAEKIALFGGVLAYAGTYTIEGDKVSHHVDVSWQKNAKVRWSFRANSVQ